MTFLSSTSLPFTASLVGALLSTAACGGSDGHGGGSDGGATRDAGTVSSDSGQQPDAERLDSGQGAVDAAVASGTCSSPRVENRSELAGTQALMLTLAVNGSHALVVFDQITGGATPRVRGQRLSDTAAPQGMPFDILGAPTSLGASALGSAFVVCESATTGVSCVTVPAETGSPATPVTISPSGTSVAVAGGTSGGLVAWLDASSIHTRPLDATGAVTGTEHTRAVVNASSLALVAHAGGYALGLTYGTSAKVIQLSADGAFGAETTLGTSRTSSEIRLASAGDAIGAVWTQDGGVIAAAVARAAEVSAVATVDAEAMSYGKVSIAAAGSGFLVGWSTFAGYVKVRALDGAGHVTGTTVEASVSWDDNANALAATPAGGALLAYANGISGEPVVTQRIACE